MAVQQDTRPLVKSIDMRLLKESVHNFNPTGRLLNVQDSTENAVLKRQLSFIQQLGSNEDPWYQLRRENTYPGTGKPRTYVPSIPLKDSTIRVFRLSCKMECFPLLQRNLKYAMDIQKHCQHTFGNGDRNNVPKSPRILNQHEIQLYIATDSDTDDISREVSAIIGDHDYSEKTDVTEKCFNKDDNIVTPDQNCSCLILFQEDETKITVLGTTTMFRAPKPAKVQSTPLIRRELTKMLGEDLFIYAEDVQKLIDDKMKLSPTPDEKSMLLNTQEAVTILLTRRAVPECRASAVGGSSACGIPEDIDSALNKMKDRGVMAFGLFVDRFVVFLDEKCDDTLQTDTKQEIMELCKNQSNFNLPVDVVTASNTFLNDTGFKQGDAILKSATTIGSIGLVTNATQPITTEAKKEADGADTSQSEQETHKNIVVAITAGHLFTQSDDAFFKKNGEMKKFGKCLTSLHREGDSSTMQYDISVIEVDEGITTSEDYDLKFRNDSGESCDGVLFKGTLDSGTVMYKKGAATGLSEGVVVSSDFRLVELVDTQKGYLIKGRDDNVFSREGDSGSFVFTLDTQDDDDRTVNLVSIATKMMSEGAARKLGIPVTLSYTVRLDRCLEKLEELTGVTVHMPTK